MAGKQHRPPCLIHGTRPWHAIKESYTTNLLNRWGDWIVATGILFLVAMCSLYWFMWLRRRRSTTTTTTTTTSTTTTTTLSQPAAWRAEASGSSKPCATVPTVLYPRINRGPVRLRAQEVVAADWSNRYLNFINDHIRVPESESPQVLPHDARGPAH